MHLKRKLKHLKKLKQKRMSQQNLPFSAINRRVCLVEVPHSLQAICLAVEEPQHKISLALLFPKINHYLVIRKNLRPINCLAKIYLDLERLLSSLGLYSRAHNQHHFSEAQRTHYSAHLRLARVVCLAIKPACLALKQKFQRTLARKKMTTMMHQ